MRSANCINKQKEVIKLSLNDIHSLSHTRWNCKYHIVFAPKYRRKIFMNEKRVEVGKILRQLCEWKGVNIIEAEASRLQRKKQPLFRKNTFCCQFSVFPCAGVMETRRISSISRNSFIRNKQLFLMNSVPCFSFSLKEVTEL